TPTETQQPTIDNLILQNPFGSGNRYFVVADYGDTEIGYQENLGGGQGIGHAGVDLLPEEYVTASIANGYKAVDEHRELFAPVSGTVEHVNDHTIRIVDVQLNNTSFVLPNLEVFLIHVNAKTFTEEEVVVGEPLQKLIFIGHGPYPPHLHLGLYDRQEIGRAHV